MRVCTEYYPVRSRHMYLARQKPEEKGLGLGPATAISLIPSSARQKKRGLHDQQRKLPNQARPATPFSFSQCLFSYGWREGRLGLTHAPGASPPLFLQNTKYEAHVSVVAVAFFARAFLVFSAVFFLGVPFVCFISSLSPFRHRRWSSSRGHSTGAEPGLPGPEIRLGRDPKRQVVRCRSLSLVVARSRS